MAPIRPALVIACAAWLVAMEARAEPGKAPDVVPGIPDVFPVARVFTEAPVAVWLDARPGSPRLMGGAAAGKGPWAVLDDGPNPLLQAPPAELAVTVAKLPRTADLHVVELRRALPAPSDLGHHYLVRRRGQKAQLVCRFAAAGPLQIQVLGRSPLRFQVTSGGERIGYGLDRAGLCEPSLPAAATDLAYENAFVHGHMLFSSGDMGKAGAAYARVVQMRAAGWHAEEAALAAIAARSNYNDLQCWGAWGDLEPRPIEGALARRISSLDDYVRLFPDSPKTPDMILRKAGDLRGCNHLEDAAALFQHVASGPPGDPRAQRARELLGEVREAIRRRDAQRRAR